METAKVAFRGSNYVCRRVPYPYFLEKRGMSSRRSDRQTDQVSARDMSRTIFGGKKKNAKSCGIDKLTLLAKTKSQQSDKKTKREPKLLGV